MKLNRIILFISLLIGVVSCNEVFEKPVEDEEMLINMPADSTISKSFSQTFWWEPVEGASNYRIQIVSPSFAEIKSITVDSILTSTKFKIALDSGNYEWMVWAFNSTSNNKGKVRPRLLTILPGSLSEQPPLEIKTPIAGINLQSDQVSFSWNGVPGSSANYTIQIDSADFAVADPTFFEKSSLLTTSYTHKFDVLDGQEARYQWRVRGISSNGIDATPWSGFSEFKIDKKAPPKVNLSLPAKGMTKGSQDNFYWEKAGDDDVSKYILYVYKNDSTSLYKVPDTIDAPTTNKSFSLGTVGEKLYWQVSAMDKAGNEGTKSDKWNFTVK